MPIATQKVIRLVFTVADGGTFTMTLPSPRADLTQAEVEQVMDLLIEKIYFDLSDGGLVAKRDAKIIETVTEDIFDPPVA
ncbi:Protein of unknown function (DUF2922) [Desulfosporosinus orientis DSM 765]|uniref:DUF2922 domain-containing protein n=1 Tax=Desulfosporosinus orientis (strain ATCC 19365 / DSM 765 / NCIMB 8382 / VKM B-1628 / Singapore I) TaxID=768706 RepID=G7W6K5_DESOD|nr:DUF2922 domain-containing protein [Desulfosporosinus orientis]AET68643.1 Protein of unknown function (DUF2922) [Desulfosporosinus orientis DSM 765]